MTKKYQNNKIDTPAGDGVAVPERVSVAMAEIAGSMPEGLLALAVGTDLQVMQVLMEADVSAVAGPKGRHDLGRIVEFERAVTRLGWLVGLGVDRVFAELEILRSVAAWDVVGAAGWTLLADPRFRVAGPTGPWHPTR